MTIYFLPKLHYDTQTMYVSACQMILYITDKCHASFLRGVFDSEWLFHENGFYIHKNSWQYDMNFKKCYSNLNSWWHCHFPGKIWILEGRHFKIVINRKCLISQKSTKLFGVIWPSYKLKIIVICFNQKIPTTVHKGFHYNYFFMRILNNLSNTFNDLHYFRKEYSWAAFKKSVRSVT
jgi:hypothetical protein